MLRIKHDAQWIAGRVGHGNDAAPAIEYAVDSSFANGGINTVDTM